MPRTKQFDQQEVLDKAVELFWKKGFHATSMQDLVDHLGINRASLYSTFGGKDELFEQALSAYRASNHSWLEVFLARHDSVKQGVYAFFAESIAQSVDDPEAKGCFAVNCITELIPGANENVQQSLMDNKAGVEAIFVRYLQKGVEQGEISKEADLLSLARLFFALSTGIRVMAKLEPDQKALQAMVKQGLAVLD